MTESVAAPPGSTHFGGSYQAVRRYLRRTYGVPPVQAVRRVETPAGVQAQHDWFEWVGEVGGAPCTVYGLIGTLSFSRATFVWAEPQHEPGRLADRAPGAVPALRRSAASGCGSIT
jgi:transposase